jgi:hypothetical protein
MNHTQAYTRSIVRDNWYRKVFDIVSEAQSILNAMDENLIASAFKDRFGRKITKKDAKQLQKVREVADFDGYRLSYKDICLGTVARTFDQSKGTCVITFMPH